MKLNLANLFALKPEGQSLNALPMEGGGGHLFKAILSNLTKGGNGTPNPSSAQAGGHQMLQQQLLACQLGPVSSDTAGEAQTTVDLGQLASSFPIMESGATPNPQPFPTTTDSAMPSGTENSQAQTADKANPWPPLEPCRHKAIQANPFALVLPQAQEMQPEQPPITLESKKPANVFQTEAPVEQGEVEDAVDESELEEMEPEQQKSLDLPLPEQGAKSPVKKTTHARLPKENTSTESASFSGLSQMTPAEERATQRSPMGPHAEVQEPRKNARFGKNPGQAVNSTAALPVAPVVIEGKTLAESPAYLETPAMKRSAATDDPAVQSPVASKTPVSADRHQTSSAQSRYFGTTTTFQATMPETSQNLLQGAPLESVQPHPENPLQEEAQKTSIPSSRTSHEQSQQAMIKNQPAHNANVPTGSPERAPKTNSAHAQVGPRHSYQKNTLRPVPSQPEKTDQMTQVKESKETLVSAPLHASPKPISGDEGLDSQRVAPRKIGAAPIPALIKPSRANPAPTSRESGDSKIIEFSEKRAGVSNRLAQISPLFAQPEEAVEKTTPQIPAGQAPSTPSNRITRLKQFVPSPPEAQIVPIPAEPPAATLAKNLSPVFGSPFGIPTAIPGGDVANGVTTTPPLNFESLSKEVFPMVKLTRVQTTGKPAPPNTAVASVETSGSQPVIRDRSFSSSLNFVMSPSPEQTGSVVTGDSPKWTYQTPEKANGHLSLVRPGPKFQVAHQSFARNLIDITQVQTPAAPTIPVQTLTAPVAMVNADLITTGAQNPADPASGEEGFKIQESQPSLPETNLSFQNSEIVASEKIHVSRVTKLLEKQLARVSLPEAQKIEIELEPDRLGKLVVELSVDKKTHKVEGHLIVANESAREALEQHLPGLKVKLTEQGIDFDSKLSLTSENHRGSDTSGRGQNGQSKTSHTPHRDAETSDGESDRTPPKGREIYA